MHRTHGHGALLPSQQQERTYLAATLSGAVAALKMTQVGLLAAASKFFVHDTRFVAGCVCCMLLAVSALKLRTASCCEATPSQLLGAQQLPAAEYLLPVAASYCWPCHLIWRSWFNCCCSWLAM